MSLDAFQRRQQARAFLTAEVEREFLGLVARINEGGKAVLVRYRTLCYEPTPECIRRIGALVVLCAMHGASVTFASDRVIEVRIE